MIKKFIFIIGLIFFCLNGSIVTSVRADSATLSISPPVVEIMLAPGKKISQTFNLKTTTQNLTLTPELHPIKPSGSRGHSSVDPLPLIPSSIPATITITGPNTSPTLTFEAANVESAQDIYLALVFQTDAADSPTSTTLSPAISALILLTINPTDILPIDLELKNFEPALLHDTWLPLKISPQAQNKSKIMIRPEGKYEIIAINGKTIFSKTLYPNLILGESSRTLELSAGDKEPPTDLSWSPKWSNLGPYRLRLTLTSQGGTNLTVVEKTIWLVPIRLGIILTLLLIIYLTLIYKRSKFKTI